MSYKAKLEEVTRFLEEHNSDLSSAEKVKPDKFKSCLRMSGVHSEKDLKDLRYEDIAKCLPKLPSDEPNEFLAKKIADIFREERERASEEEAKKMSAKELLSRYNPYDEYNPIGDRLHEMSSAARFIVFNDDGTVNVEKSAELLEELMQNYPPVDKVEVDNKVKATHEVGEAPAQIVDENPLYPERPLRTGQKCDQTGRSWQGIDKKIRQFLRLWIKENSTPDIDKAHDLIDMAMQENAMEELQKRYRDIATKFNKKKETDNLPQLKVKLKNNQVEKRKGSDFTVSGGEKVV